MHSKCYIKCNNEASPACKEAFVSLLQFSFEKIKCFFSTRNTPTQIMEESFERCSIPFEKGHFSSKW